MTNNHDVERTGPPPPARKGHPISLWAKIRAEAMGSPGDWFRRPCTIATVSNTGKYSLGDGFEWTGRSDPESPKGAWIYFRYIGDAS